MGVLVQGVSNAPKDFVSTKTKSPVRIIIESKRIISYHILRAIPKHNRIFAYLNG